ncbi:GNAT family N-acetyltransferase [Bosea psychrotolerans]|uniref:Putative GNAT family acetyltransferase n=1 Tax=Bosea psychrotolerans TaxID=1871628 RepID=A0A2S4M2F5_9HYPH|nr:GNAT family N-acetyltransferase [Bosea psychrotolerans]POR48906.1 putative GNAT family acetyltransferase [Bosea psychrotolerans]
MRSEHAISDKVLAVLRRAPLDNVVLLKFLLASPQAASVHQIVRGDDAATLLLLDHRFSDFDRETYPAASASALIASTNPELTQDLLAFVPRRETLVFKLANEADRSVVAAEFPLERRTAFLSYTATIMPALDTGADIETTTAKTPFEILAAQGHSAEWLGPLIASGRAFICVLRAGSRPLSACFAFQIDGPVWEVGGVYTQPAERGKGLAYRIVHTALAELQRRGHVARYQVSEENTASIRLAESLGMKRYLTLTHYLSAPDMP